MSGRGLRVCHLTKYYPPFLGGIERHVQILAQGQAALGADVRVLAINHRGAGGAAGRIEATVTAEELDGGVRVTRFGRRAGLSGFDLCPGLTEWIRREVREGLEILHLHTPNPTMMLAVARLAPGAVRLVITHHNDIVRQRVARALLRPIEARVYRRSARVLTASPPYAASSRVLRPVADWVEPVPLGIDLAPLLEPSAAARAHAQELCRRFGTTLWLCVGRLVYYKGLHVALRALARVPGQLLVIGVGPLGPALRTLADRLGMADRVIWWGPATEDQLIGSYLAASALWFPSVARTEGFGLVQVEAMAAGCPIINTHLAGSGVAWVSPDGVTGLTVPVGDAGALADAARRLLDEPGLRDRLATEGPARARREFDQAIMVRRVLEAYLRALDAPPR